MRHQMLESSLLQFCPSFLFLFSLCYLSLSLSSPFFLSLHFATVCFPVPPPRPLSPVPFGHLAFVPVISVPGGLSSPVLYLLLSFLKVKRSPSVSLQRVRARRGSP